MVHFYLDAEPVSVPFWVTDLATFRRWADSDEFPDDGRIDFFLGQVWITDMGKEQLFSHVLVKTESSFVLTGLSKVDNLGLYFGDGAYLTNERAELSVKPDGCFVSTKSFERGRVQLVPGRAGGYVELIGVPDMLLEVVSDSSVDKDNVYLRDKYAKAGIREYWIIDVRGKRLRLEILSLTDHEYVAVRPRDKWIKSKVFGKSFRLERTETPAGVPSVTLLVK